MRRRGVAEFERYAAEHEVAAPFDAVTRLYQVRRGSHPLELSLTVALRPDLPACLLCVLTQRGARRYTVPRSHVRTQQLLLGTPCLNHRHLAPAGPRRPGGAA